MTATTAQKGRRLLRLLGAVTLGSVACLSVVAPAQAEHRAAPQAAIRGAHFSPTTPGVDVYLSKFSGGKPATTLWLSKVHYGAVSPYQGITPGVYTVSMRAAGAPASSKPVLSWTLRARPGAAYTVAGVGAGASVRGIVIKDNLNSPPNGDGSVRVIQAASRAPVAKVISTTGNVIASDAKFASVSNYAHLPARTWNVKAESTSSPSVATTAPVTVKNGQITSILLLDSKSKGIELRTVVDSASSGVQPRDAVPAGGGGMATSFVDVPGANGDNGTDWAPFGIAGAAVLMLLGGGAVVRRRRAAA